jgi:hypothetical protein
MLILHDCGQPILEEKTMDLLVVNTLDSDYEIYLCQEGKSGATTIVSTKMLVRGYETRYFDTDMTQNELQCLWHESEDLESFMANFEPL